MNSYREGDALSLRLTTLQSYYSGEEFIWDIGCDHGLLGLSFAHLSGIRGINLVDPSKIVIDVLKEKIKGAYIAIGTVNIFRNKGQEIKIDSKSNCIFIAGMGGEEIADIVLKILPGLDSSSKIVISPHRKNLELRALLRALPISLKKEEVLFEDGQFYPILELVPGEGPKVGLFGDNIWKGELGERYRIHQIKFFSSHRDGASQDFVSYLKSLSP
jgi:tRNA (adenine22-N1)-methyltransferase